DVPSLFGLPVQRAMGLIQQRYWDRLSLSALARQVGMSKYRLSHRFRDVAGGTLPDYLLKGGLDPAKGLLAAGRPSLTPVAPDVGFCGPPRLRKVFKRHTGSPPSTPPPSTPPP